MSKCDSISGTTKNDNSLFVSSRDGEVVLVVVVR